MIVRAQEDGEGRDEKEEIESIEGKKFIDQLVAYNFIQNIEAVKSLVISTLSGESPISQFPHNYLPIFQIGKSTPPLSTFFFDTYFKRKKI